MAIPNPPEASTETRRRLAWRRSPSTTRTDPQFRQEYPAWQAIRDSLQNASVRPETSAYQSISIVVADLLNPPSQIDLDTIVPRLTEEVERAVQSEGLVP